MFQLFQRPTCPLLRDSSDAKTRFHHPLTSLRCICLMVKIHISVTNVIWQEEFALLQS